MQRKRYTIELVLEVPAKYDLGNAIRINENSIVIKKSFKILKSEDFEEWMPHEQKRGEKRALRETILELFKKHKLPLLVYVNQDWGDGIDLLIYPSKPGTDAYLARHGNPQCAKDWDRYSSGQACKECRSVARSFRVHIEDGEILEKNWDSKSKQYKGTSFGSIADPEMTQFMKHLNKTFGWVRKP